MVSVENISVSFGSFELLNGISFLINRNDRIGLAGKNGAGKSTLLKIIAGLQSPTSGKVTMPAGCRVGYLPQQMIASNTTTVLDETLKAFEELLKIAEEIEMTGNEIASRTDYESDAYLRLCDKLTLLEERYRMLGGNDYMSEIEKTLFGLGFERDDFGKPTSLLSEGWRMRIELAKIILRKPDLMLLDEPTNHLDIESIQWLETYLEDYPGALILVSHDRALLDNVTRRTIEISLGKIYDYRVPWSQFVELRKERREQQLAAFRNQQKMIADTEKFIERFRYKATKAVQVQSRIKQLNKLERIEVDEEDYDSINIRFAAAPRSGTVVIKAENLSKSYGTHPVLDNINITVTRGEKVAFVGRNGEGKTTLARIIAGELDYNGKLSVGHNVKIGYYAQNHDEIIRDDKTVYQTVDEVAKGEIRTRLREILAAFLFRGDDIDKKVKVLSGGERSRLALVKLLLEPYNLLLLDEPTNHLDMRSKDILKQALQNYDGTLIVVSHDRDFLENLTDKIYEFRNKKIKEFTGTIHEFLIKKKMESLRELERKEAKPVEKIEKENLSANKIRYLEKKEYEKNLRRLKRRIEIIEDEIEEIEKEIAIMDKILSDSGNIPQDSAVFFNRYNSFRKELENKISLWEQYNTDLESFLNTI